MRRHQAPHQHACQTCGAATPCDGAVEQNYDGWPEWICTAFHLPGGGLNPDFVCSRCHEARLDAEEERERRRAKKLKPSDDVFHALWVPPEVCTWQTGPGVHGATTLKRTTCPACRAWLATKRYHRV